MKSNVEALLHEKLPHHFKCKVYATPTIVDCKQDFCLSDNRATVNEWIKIALRAPSGTAVFHNSSGRSVSIFDYESYIKTFKVAAVKGLDKCDFIITTTDDTELLIFNELTEAKSEYVRKNNYEKLHRQLRQSIETLQSVDPNFFDSYTKKIALFSWKNTDAAVAKKARQSLKPFTPIRKIANHIQRKQPLPADFKLIAQEFPAPYTLF